MAELAYPSFEGGWHRETCRGEFGEIFVPQGWQICWKEGLPVSHDPTNNNGYGRPEVKLIEPVVPYLDPLRVRTGKGLLLFTFFRIHDVAIYQQVEAHGKYRLTAWAHAWSSTEDDPKKSTLDKESDRENFMFMVGIDPTGATDPWAETVQWGEGAHIYDRFAPIPALEIECDGLVTVFIRSTCKWPFKHNDAYIDDVEWAQVQTPTEPPDDTCYGKPREPYAAVRWVLPTGCTQDNREDALSIIGQTEGTLCYSMDDACQGHNDNITVNMLAYTPEDFPLETYRNFQTTYYPHVKAINRIIRYAVTPEPEPEPGAPPMIKQTSNNLIGWQHAYEKQLWDAYMREARPTAIKVFTCGHAMQAAKIAQQINGYDPLIIWRKVVEKDQEYMDGNHDDMANKLLGLYTNEINAWVQNEGYKDEWNMTHIDVARRISVIESINETVPSNNASHITRAVAFDVRFTEKLRARYPTIKAGIGNIAVGNPLESEFHYLLPLARISHEGKAMIGYHGYWSAEQQRDWLVERWPYLAGRWTEMDKVFNAGHYYPTYYLGESGMCWSPDNGWYPQPRGAWKACGDFPNYLRQIKLMNDMILSWNKYHQGRCYGATLFIYGHDGWQDFDIGLGDMGMMIQQQKELI